MTKDMNEKVSDLYASPILTRQRAGNEIDILYILKMTRHNDPKDFYSSEQQFSPSQETIENVSRVVAKMTFDMVNLAQMHINKGVR